MSAITRPEADAPSMSLDGPHRTAHVRAWKLPRDAAQTTPTMPRPTTPPVPADARSVGLAESTPAVERVLRRLLRAPSGPPTATDDETHRLFSASIAISALRCLLTYIVLPVLIPLIGPASLPPSGPPSA
jgi:hypothetical protein